MMSFLKSLLFGSDHDLGPAEAVSAINAGAQVLHRSLSCQKFLRPDL